MRKTLWIILTVLFVAIGGPNAHADSIIDGTINFSVTSGSPSPTGSFVLDATTDTFTSFTVEWDGQAWIASPLTLTSTHLTSFLSGGTWCAAGPANNSPCIGSGLFVFFFPAGAEDAFATTPFTFTNVDAAATGTYSITETAVATPEPTSLLLLGTGLLGCSGFLRRKRLA